ncbi:unnamed protein product [Prunus brigantina]
MKFISSAETKLVIKYNKRGKPYGPAHTEMQSYIGVLARSRVLIVDKKWTEILKDIKEQIWEAVDMAYVVGQGGKKMVLSSAGKKWKDFKSTLTRHHILPFINEKEKLRQPTELYKFIERADWDAFRREKCEYNHRLSRKGYVGLEDELEETMSPCGRKLEKTNTITSPIQSNDVLTTALGPKHPGRVRGVGAEISTRQYFNLPRQQRLRQLIPKFDPSVLKLTTIQGPKQSPKNPMSDKASCSGALDVRALNFVDDNAKDGVKQQEMKSKDVEQQDEMVHEKAMIF